MKAQQVRAAVPQSLNLQNACLIIAIGFFLHLDCLQIPSIHGLWHLSLKSSNLGSSLLSLAKTVLFQ